MKLNVARGDFLRELVLHLKPALQLQTALDVGCGFGYLSAVLRDTGLKVTAFDGRPENVEEARKRVPDVLFSVGDIESPEVRQLGKFDLVVCFGLLYHLENPFQAVRNLHHLTEGVIVLESMCLPGNAPSMLLLDEGPTPDQGLQHVGFYPSEPCITKMCFRAGFPYLYRSSAPPKHTHFRSSLWTSRQRTVLLASRTSLESALLIPMGDVGNPADPWRKYPAKLASWIRVRWGS